MPSEFNPDINYSLPSVTAYNRLMPVPVSIDYEKNLRAEVHDALWFASRQWQMGEFMAEDAGAPAFAKLESSQTAPLALQLDPNPAIPAETYNYKDAPLEVLVEREAVRISIHMRIQAGFYFQKLLTVKNLSQFLAAFIENYPLPVTDLPEWDTDGALLLAAVRGNIADGILIATDLNDAGRLENWIKSTPSMLAASKELLNVAAELAKWIKRMYPLTATTIEAAAPRSWRTEQLEYGLSLEMKDAASGKTSRVLATGYEDGQLDWPDFTWAGSTVVPNATRVVEEFIPTPVRYSGMPSSRFWEMEEGYVNFGKLSMAPSNILSVAFAEFGLAYSNDWFWFPMPLKINAVCKIEKLELTNVFGEKTFYAPQPEPDDPLKRFSMYQLSDENNLSVPIPYLPPTLAKIQEGEPIERVHFIRDEQSNLAWAVETVIPSATHQGIKTKTVAPDQVAPPDATTLTYKLGNLTPENWTPFIPVRLAGQGRTQNQTRLQRARMPESKPPRGQILQDKKIGTPYFIREEEISRSGAVVERNWQRARWLNGKTFTWIGRRKVSGRFESSYGLSWDTVALE